MSKIYRVDNPTIGDLEKGDYVRFPDGAVYRCDGLVRVKKSLGGQALKFTRTQLLTARMFDKPLRRLERQDWRAWYEWTHDQGAES